MLRPFSLLLVVTFLMMISCEPQDQDIPTKGAIKFHFAGSAANGRVKTDIKNVMVTIANENGDLAYDNVILPVIQFGDGYHIEPLSLEIGDYYLTELIVLNADNVALYATPNIESELAHLVTNPLPIDFQITSDAVTDIEVEVVEITSDNDHQFGYAIVSFNVVKTFSFKFAVFSYDNSTGSYELVAADLLVTGEHDSLHTQLEAITNSIALKDSDSILNVQVSKAGFSPYVKTFHSSELKSHKNDPLIVILSPLGVAEGLEVYYPFAGNADDASGNNRHGIPYGVTLTTDRFNTPNSAYYFDGDDHIDLGNILDDLELPFTFSSWIKLDDSLSVYNSVFTSQDNQPYYNGFDVNINSDGFGIGYGDGLGENNGAYRRGKSVSINAIGTWTHFTAVVVNSDSLAIYVNGVEMQGTFSGSTTRGMNSNFPLDVARIGVRTSNGGTYYFKGSIDELKVWSRPLSVEEIAVEAGL